MSAATPKPVSKLRSVVNIAIGLLILVGAAWWAVTTCTAAQESRRFSIEEWTRLQAFMDQRWSKLKDLGVAYEETRPNKIVNPFDVGNGPRHPIHLPGTPEYTFQEYARWNSAAGLADRIETIRSLEGCMPDFLRSLEAGVPMSANAALAGFHRDLAISQNELQMHIASYDKAALTYNQKLNQFPARLLLKRFDFQPLPRF